MFKEQLTRHVVNIILNDYVDPRFRENVPSNILLCKRPTPLGRRSLPYEATSVWHEIIDEISHIDPSLHQLEPWASPR